MDNKIKVLMVDDEAQFRATTDKILTRRGFDTIMAESGEVALTQLSKNRKIRMLSYWISKCRVWTAMKP